MRGYRIELTPDDNGTLLTELKVSLYWALREPLSTSAPPVRATQRS
jgi:hypothetical protein